MNSKQSGGRRFLTDGAALAGLAVGTIRSASGQTPGSEIPEVRPKDYRAYGERSRFVPSVRALGDPEEKRYRFMPMLTPLQDSLGIVTLADGMPVTVLTGFNRSGSKANVAADRPNLLPGKSNNPVLGGPDKYFDPTVFALPPAGFYGNLGRDTLISPGFAAADATLTKVFPVSERLKVNFRAEFFNFLNRANFGLPRNTIFNSNGTIQPNAGRIDSTVNTSRQIQFGLKLLF